MRLQNLVDQKQICEQRAKMDRCVQIVDQLRADGGLGENQLHGGQGIAGVTVKHGKIRIVPLGGLEIFLFHRGGQKRRPAR